MSLVKQLAGETAIYGLSNILGRILHFVVFTMYLTREFSDRALFGIYQDLYSYAAFLLIIFTYRFETAYFRFGSKKEAEHTAFSTASSSIIGTTLLLTITLIAFRQDLADLLLYPDRSRYIIYFAMIIGLDAMAAIPFARLRLSNRPLRFAFIKILNIVFTLVLVLFFLEGCPWLIDQGYSGLDKIYSLENRLDLVFISNLIASALVFIMLLPEFLKVRFHFDKRLWIKMARYALPLIIVGLAGVFNQYVAVPLLKYLLPGSLEDNLSTGGLYGAVAKLAIIMNLFTQAFNYAAEPFFFKQADDKNAKKTYADVAQAFALIASIAFLVIILYIDVVKLILGPNYREGIHIVPILLLANWFLGMYYNFSIWYKIKDKTHIGALISIGGAIITILIAFLMVPKVGYEAMAWATLGCYSFMALAGYLTGRHYYPVPYPVMRIGLYIGSAVLFMWLGNLLSTSISSPIVLFLSSTVLFISYLALWYRIERKTLQEWWSGTRPN